MKYKVVYKTVQEILDSYMVIPPLISANLIYECAIIEGKSKMAKFIATAIPYKVFDQQSLLKQILRCYIIETDDMQIPALDILERYR